MLRNHFEQQFEDSEANFSQVQPDPTALRSQGKPLQLLKIQRNGRIEINEDALNLLASCNAQVALASIVGKMRTGKSCLLNRMLGLAGKGFTVDASVSSCTQGIWMWSEPLFNQANNCFVFFLDTEGSDSLEKDADNDSKIFTLALLISSYLIYNSVGCIDQRSLSQLQMVTALAQLVRTDERLSEKQNQQQLFRYMPKFLWLLRDVTLQIMDDRGRKISPTLYLQNCLNDQSSKSTENSRNIKKSLLTHFKDRECITLVRPVGDETELQRLNSLPDHALRRQFVEAVGQLREKIVQGCIPKQFGSGEASTGPVLAQLLEFFVEAFNSGKVPSIRNAWQQIQEDQGISAHNAALARYEQIFHMEFPDDSPKTDQQIRRILIRLREETTKEFDEHCYNRKHEDIRKKLKSLIDEKESNIIEINRNVCQAKNNEILKSLSQKLKTKLIGKAYTGKQLEAQKDFDEIIARYNEDARGAGKAEILAEFMRTINPLLLSVESDHSKNKEEEQRNRIRMNQLQAANKLKEQELKSLRNQLKQQKDNMLPPPPTKPVKDKLEKEREKGTQGCCSGDKCIIM